MNRRGLLCGLVAAPALVFGRSRPALAAGIPSTLHPGEIVLSPAQQAQVAGSGLTAEQVAAVVDQANKAFARNIGPMLSDYQRRHG